jgi:hypothetical protein
MISAFEWEGRVKAYYDFNQTSGSNLPDIVTGTYNLTNLLMDNSNWVSGKLGTGDQALEYNGAGQLSFGAEELNMAGNFSISLWIKPTGLLTENSFALSKFNGAGYNTAWYYTTDGRIIWRPIEADLEVVQMDGPIIADETWVHLVATANGTHYVLYINATQWEVASYDGTNYENDFNLTLGGRGRNGPPDDFFNGSIDEVGFFNVTLTPAEVDELYNFGDGLQYATESLNLNITYPIDTVVYDGFVTALNYTQVDAEFCWYSFDGGTNNGTSVAAGTNWTGLTSVAGVNNWTVYCNNSEGNLTVDESSFTVNVSLTTDLISPVDNANITIDYQEFVHNFTPENLNMTNTTFFIWHDNGTLFDSNTTSLSTDGVVQTSTNITNLLEDTYYWNAETCSADSCVMAEANRTITYHATSPSVVINYPGDWIRYFVEGDNMTVNWTISESGQPLTHIANCTLDYNGVTYVKDNTDCTVLNETTIPYEHGVNVIVLNATDIYGVTNSTSQEFDIIALERSNEYSTTAVVTTLEKFGINITTNGTAATNQKLFYNAVKSDADVMSIGGNNYTISATKTVTSNGIFEWFMSFDVGDFNINSTARNQTVTDITLALCNATYDVTYLNFSFADESDLSVLNASNDLTEVTYWITGAGDDTRSLLTSNASENYYYAFCFEPSNEDITLNMEFKYSKDTYPLRTFSFSEADFTNTSTEQTLYLLGTADGIYSSVQVTGQTGSAISGVSLTMERQINGVYVTVGQDTTGNDGVSTFWVNPNFAHRITASKSGYANVQYIFTPSQTIYTLTMSKDTNSSYTEHLAGILWRTFPSSGIIGTGVTNFNTTVTADDENLVNCMFELINTSNPSQILNSTTGVTNSTYCQLVLTYNVTEATNIFGRLSINTTQSGGWVVVDSDWKWITLDTTIKGWRKLTSIFEDLATIGEFGEGDRAEFNRVMFFFIVMTILIGVFHYFTGIDVVNPGISLLVIMVIAWLVSLGGFLTVPIGSENAGTFWGQYAIAMLITMINLNYFFKTWREENR